MIEEINQMKMELRDLMKVYDMDDEIVIEASCKLDNLILDYYSKGYHKLKLEDNCKNDENKKDKNTLNSIRSSF